MYLNVAKKLSIFSVKWYLNIFNHTIISNRKSLGMQTFSLLLLDWGDQCRKRCVWPEENFMLQFSIKKLNLWKDPIVALTNQPGNPISPFLCFWLLRAFFNCETKKIWEKVWRGKLLWKQHRKKPCTIYTVCIEIYELFWNKIRQYYILNNWNTFRKLFSWVPVRVAIYSRTCIVKLRDMWHKLLEKERNEMVSSKKWKVSECFERFSLRVYFYFSYFMDDFIEFERNGNKISRNCWSLSYFLLVLIALRMF